MTVLENMQAVLPSLPKNERKAAEYLLNYPHDIQRRSAEVIAQDAGISRSAMRSFMPETRISGMV